MKIIDYRFPEKSDDSFYRLLHYSHYEYSADHPPAATLHSHPTCELIYVLKGSGIFLQNDFSVPIKSGDLIFVNSFTQHYECPSKTDPFECLFFAVDTFSFKEEYPDQTHDVISDTDKRTPFEKIYIFEMSNLLPVFADLSAEFDHELEKRELYYEPLVQSRFCSVFLSVLRQTKLQTQKVRADIAKNARIPIAAAQYLETYFYCEHSLEELAKRFYISKNHLTFAFKKQFGITPLQYLKNVRVKEAQNLLCTTNRSISEIATQVGFINASYFARVYKQRAGITPSQEREKALRALQNNSE